MNPDFPQQGITIVIRVDSSNAKSKIEELTQALQSLYDTEKAPKPNVELDVEEPKPVEVEETKLVDVAVNEPKPLDVAVNEPKPLDVAVNEPKPVESEQSRAQAAADAYAKEAGEAHDAQDRYDMLVKNGGSRKEKSAALAALQKEQREAEDAKHEMERVAAQVANTLQGINAQIKALASAVKKAEGRLAQNQADAPEG